MNVESIKSRSKAERPKDPPNTAVGLIIDGRRYAVTQLGEDRSATVALTRPVERGQILASTLVAAMDGFDLSVAAMWEVISEGSGEPSVKLQLAEANPAARLATVDTIIAAIASGDLLSADEALDLAHRDPGKHHDEQDRDLAEPHTDRPVRRRAGAIAFVLLGLALLAFIAANLATRAWVVRADGAIINAQSLLARAPQAAELVTHLVPVGERVARNRPVALVKSASGQVLTIMSPCDCIVGSQLVTGRAALRTGDPITQLVPAAGANNAILSMKIEDLRRVRVGDRVTATFYDSDAKLEGRIDRVSPPKSLNGRPERRANLAGTIEVRFDRRIPAWRVGEPIAAQIVVSRRNPFA